VFLAAGVGYYEADVFVGDLFGDGFLDGFEQIQAEAGTGFENVLLVDGMDPIGAEGQLAFLNKVGNQGDDGGDFSAAKLGDFFEGATLIQEFERFLRWACGLGMPFFGGAFAIGKTAEGVEDFFAIEFAFFFAHAGDLAEFGDGVGLGLADGVESGVVENDESGDHFLAGGVSAPFAEKFAEFFVHANGGIQLVLRRFEDAVGILGWLICSG